MVSFRRRRPPVQFEKLHLPAALVLVILTINIPSFAAGHELVLHVFGQGKDGGHPVAGLVSDRSGNLYGTTIGGGTHGWGTVFELVRGANRQWSEKVLYSFQGGNDGSMPYGALVIDSSGNLYGTTDSGGGGSNCGQGGCGTVFELIDDANGKWKEKILHRFNRADGDDPQADLAIDTAGVLYGTTYFGGEGNTCWDPSGDTSCGVVFELTPDGGRKWAEKVLHSFNYNNGKDGSNPSGNPVVLDASGNLYGTTGIGGTGQCYDDDGDLIGCGTAFELRKGSDGRWVEKVVHNFGVDDTDGSGPFGLVSDSKGSFYGTTTSGGKPNHCGSGCGTVFKLAPEGDAWREEVLFAFDGNNGETPVQPTIDKNGNLYGTTVSGGANSSCNYGFGCGTVFALLAEKNGRWAQRTLHSFDGHDGNGPNGGLVLDPAGDLYGTAFEGGKVTECGDQSGCGVVFKIAR
jgi:uncharacterized repeat protein (TIGR03803 family)